MKTRIFRRPWAWGLALCALSTAAAARDTPRPTTFEVVAPPEIAAEAPRKTPPGETDEHAQKRELVRRLWKERNAAERANEAPPMSATERGQCDRIAFDFFWQPANTPSAWISNQLEKATFYFGEGNKMMAQGDFPAARNDFWWATHGAKCAMETAEICRRLQPDLACLLADVLFLERNPSAEWLLLPRFSPAAQATADGFDDIPHLGPHARLIHGQFVITASPATLLRGAAEDAEGLCEALRTGRPAYVHAQTRRMTHILCHALAYLHDLQSAEPAFQALLDDIRRAQQECDALRRYAP